MSGESAIHAAVTAAELAAAPGLGGHDLNLRLADKLMNDLGNAQRMLERYRGDVLFVRDVGWHVWDGRRWKSDGAEDAVNERAHLTAMGIFDEVEAVQRQGRREDDGETQSDFTDRCERLFKWANKSGERRHLEAMVSVAKTYLSVSPHVMDADPVALNLGNGTLRLAGDCAGLGPHEREDRLTRVMDVDFNPEAQCPVFHAFLARVQPDETVRMFLQRWFGYCLTGITREQVLVFFYGTGANGKSTLLNIMARILGPYSVSLPFASLLRDDNKRGDSATPDLARLPGARLVRASEPEHGARFAESTIKSVTGGEEMTARHLYRGFFDFIPHFKLVLSGNHKPSIRGQDHGIWRRVRLVPWPVTLPRAEWDVQLEEKLWAERSGILNWMLDGCRLWLESGLQEPPAVMNATEEYRTESDQVGRFIKECVRHSPGDFVQASGMYAAYLRWCKANAERPWSLTAFGKALPERGVKKSEMARIRQYLDVRLENVPEEAAEPPSPHGPEDYGHG